MLSQLSRYSLRGLPRQFQCYALYGSRNSSSSPSKKVAVVLSGSGVFDGSEIHESAAILSHLTREGVVPVCYAPDINQMHVVDHIKGSPSSNEVRNVLTESARIARGQVQPLSSLHESSADAVVFPGGFGAAKNLSSFATHGPDCEVHNDVVRVLCEFHSAKKPIALCCIAPVLAAKVFGNVTITLGQEDNSSGKWPHSESIQHARKLGANMESKNVNEVSFDEKNLLISTPAFMYEGKFHEISDGIGLMIKKLVSVMNSSSSSRG